MYDINLFYTQIITMLNSNDLYTVLLAFAVLDAFNRIVNIVYKVAIYLLRSGFDLTKIFWGLVYEAFIFYL